jgi:hypothetical protein
MKIFHTRFEDMFHLSNASIRLALLFPPVSRKSLLFERMESEFLSERQDERLLVCLLSFRV